MNTRLQLQRILRSAGYALCSGDVLEFLSSEKVEFGAVTQTQTESALVDLQQLRNIGSQLALKVLDREVQDS